MKGNGDDMLTPVNLNLETEMQNPEYRHEFYITRTKDLLATNIRELRESKGLTQVELAKACGTQQSGISRIEDSDYSGWSFATLTALAKALDARLEIKFVPFEPQPTGGDDA